MDGIASKTRRIPVWAVLLAFFVLPLVVIGGVELAQNLVPRDLRAEASLIMSLPPEAQVVSVRIDSARLRTGKVDFKLPNSYPPQQWLDQVFSMSNRRTSSFPMVTAAHNPKPSNELFRYSLTHVGYERLTYDPGAKLYTWLAVEERRVGFATQRR